MSIARTISFIQRRYCQTGLKRNVIKEFNEKMRMPRGEKSKIAKLLYVIPISTFCLGTWQIQRRLEKLEIIKRLEERLNEEPIELPKDLRDLEDFEYRKFIVKGKFDHSKEIIIQPRCRIDDKKPSGGVFSRNVKNGAWVITPLKLSDRNYSILINRGFVPKSRIKKERRRNTLTEDEVTVIGILRTTDKRSPFQMKNRLDIDLWNHRDVENMALTRDAAPVFLDAIRDSSDDLLRGPIGGQTQISVRNDHLSYIITWYSLSLITFLMTKKFLRYQKWQ